MYKKILLTLMCVLLAAGMAQAKIQYVDASLDNTKIGGETPTTEPEQIGTYHLGSGDGTDGLWDWRPDQPVNGGNVWQSDNAVVPEPSFDAESTNELSVTMTIPLAGTYDIYGYFIAGEPSWLWDCAFSLNPDPCTVYDMNNSTAALASDFTGTVLVENLLGVAEIRLYQAALGPVTTTSDNEQVTVYVQGLDSGVTSPYNQRTWFEGIGYDTELYVVVEPGQIVAFPGEAAIYTATPSAPASGYQWYKGQSGDANNPLAYDPNHISGSDSNELTIIVQAGDEGYYWCKAVIGGNNLASQTVSLVVMEPMPILESFEYTDQAEMCANGWTIMYGSGGTPTTDVAHTGAKAVKVDGTGINGISKEFFAEDQNNVEVTIQWYYDPVADFNSRDSCVQIFEKDGGPGGYGIMLRHQSNHRFIWRVDAATYAWGGSVFQVGWNEVRVSYDENAADVYFNDVYQTTYATTGFSKICLFRSWYQDPSCDVAWDDLTISPTPKAHAPQPVNGANGIMPDVTLSWAAGYGACSHDVYFGTNYNQVNNATRVSGDIDGSGQVDMGDLQLLVAYWLQDPNGSEPYVDINRDGDVDLVDFAVLSGSWQEVADSVYKGNQDSNSYALYGLEHNTYYWRIDEVAGANTVKGHIWSFMVGYPVQVTASEGWNIYDPPSEGHYRYGPSIIINDDNSIDIWCSSPGDANTEFGWIRHKNSTDGGDTWGTETIVLQPTPDSADRHATCDPGVIKFGGYYYLGYSGIEDPNAGENNHVFVARSTSPTGPYEKWNGSGWGGNPQPFIVYTGSPGDWGAGEPSFVVKDGTLYVYYSWWGSVNETRVATVPASDPNWPGSITYQGTALTRFSSEDSTDVKYVDAMERFIGIATADRFTADSYIHVWESTDGLSFVSADEVTDNTQAYAHNAGISGTAEGHMDLDDDNFIAYAYKEDPGDPWGYWHMWLNPVTLE